MNQDLTPKSILLILLPFCFLLFLFIWANDQAVKASLPGKLKKTPWNTLSVTFTDGLIYEFSDTGKLIRTIHTQDLGIPEIRGDIQFLSKNELLIYGGHEPLGLDENLKSYARIKSTEEYSQSEGLWRCHLVDYQCETFSTALPNMKGVFHMTYDFDRNHLYVAHTRGHKLYRLDNAGQVLDITNAEELKFPNTLFIHQDDLWQLDTNHKQVKAFDLHSASLSSPSTSFDVQQDTGCSQIQKSLVDHFSPNPKCWPGSMAKVKDEIWVSVMENNMENGEIHRYDFTGKLRSKVDLKTATAHLALPYENDPVSIVGLENATIIQDLNNLTLLRFDLESGQANAFLVEEVSDRLTAALTHKQFYKRIADVCLYVFFALLAVGFLFALYDHLKQSREKKQTSPLAETHHQEVTFPSSPFWFTPSKTALYGKWIVLFGGAVTILMTLALYTQLKPEESGSLLVIIPMIVSVILPAYLALQAISNKRLGVAGRLIMVSERNGHTAMCPINEAKKVGQRGILVEDTLFVYGNAQYKMVDKHQFEQYLAPLLTRLENMSEQDYLKYRWKSRHKESVIIGLSMIPAFVMAIYLTLTT